MSNSSRRPILVTGSHRSGSSWVGKMISLSPSVAYINEPFNIEHTPRVCRANFRYWFTHICESNQSTYFRDIRDCLDFKYPMSAALRSSKSAKDLAKLVRDFAIFAASRVSRKRPLLKDPIALFSAEWLASTFDMDVIVLIRHPAAFAGSLKSSQWTHPFNHFLEQPLLMERHLSGYRREIEEYSKNEKPILDQAILLWNLIHHMILEYSKRHPNWTFVRHEDLSENPLDEFRSIYSKLALEFPNDIEHRIQSFCTADHSKGIKRDSKSNRWSWKMRLTAEEISAIRNRTQEVADAFYSAADWG